MVKIVFLLMLVLVAPASPGGTGIELSIKTDKIEYGKPVFAVLRSSYSQPSLETLDFSRLARDFVIEQPWEVMEDAHGAKQYWRIRLHPRRPGKLAIPSLGFQGEKTAPINILVTPPLDPADKAAIQLTSEVGDTSVWLNQAVPVSLIIENNSPYVLLESDVPLQSGIAIERLPIIRHTRKMDGVERTKHRLTWMLYPQTTGKLRVQLPAIEYRRDGVTTHRFFPPEVNLEVLPLPVFVPPTLPVGRISVEMAAPVPFILLRNKLSFLTLRMKKLGPGNGGFGQVLRQFRSNRQITFHAPQQVSEEHDRRTYRIPFELNSMGLAALPSLRLQYFDPSSGKLQTETHTLGSIVVVSQWVVYAVFAVSLLGLFLVSRKIYRWLKQRYQRYKYYRRALRLFQHADTPAAIREGVQEIAKAEGWPTNLTLNAWLKHWSTRYPQRRSTSDAVILLQNASYAGAEISLDEIQHCFIAICYRQAPLLKILKLGRNYSTTI